MTSCSPFHYLTTLPPDGTTGPKASDCGSCHIEQYEEWAGSPHALALLSSAFQAVPGAADDEDCLACHTPLDVRESDPVSRNFNRKEGITCISCHLSRGTMHGPHESSALFQPHPVQEKDMWYKTVKMCASCHEETADEYESLDGREKLPTCLDCHATSRHRTMSQGNNFLSSILVSFEETVDTHSHHIALATMTIPPNASAMKLIDLQTDQKKTSIKISIQNRLPHNLPTGTYGSKTILLDFRLHRAGILTNHNRIKIMDEENSLSSYAIKTITVTVNRPVLDGDIITLQLERSSMNNQQSPVILSTRDFSLPL